MSRTQPWSEPHHDGSALYVANPAPELGETVPVFLRVPRESGVGEVHLSHVVDGERLLAPATVDRTDEWDTWFRADLPVHNPVATYRWLLDGGAHGFQWLNGTGLHARQVTDAADFRLAAFAPPPDWGQDAVLYQVFPDRFAKSRERDAPEWAIPAAWDAPLGTDRPTLARQFYGGDLDGVAAHLDHIASLGANTVYLTPFFPAGSTHRYDATTFGAVDPLLGGDEALARLSDALHARGMRLMGDLTTNHCGVGHDWFRAAVADPGSPEAGFFHFERHPDAYACWLGHPTLPKLDLRNPALRRALVEGGDSVVGRWLGVLDGWRIDVANMTGRHRDVDVAHDVARAIRATLAEVRPDALLLAEHNFDASADLLGDGWHGTMNYTGFSIPAWQWLSPERPLRHSLYADTPRLPGGAMVAGMREVAASVPWRATAHAMNLVSSHDSERIRTRLGDDELVVVALGLMATMPGIPMIWSGDEIGMEGTFGEDGRRPFPWDGPWNERILGAVRALFGARRESVALRRGGLRWLVVDDDVAAFAREAPGETVVVQVSRADHAPVWLPAGRFGREWSGLAGTVDVAPIDGVVELPGDGPAVRMWRTR